MIAYIYAVFYFIAALTVGHLWADRIGLIGFLVCGNIWLAAGWLKKERRQ